MRTHLFTPFFSTKENGQGIGLTMVQEILAGHGFPFALEATGGRADDLYGDADVSRTQREMMNRPGSHTSARR